MFLNYFLGGIRSPVFLKILVVVNSIQNSGNPYMDAEKTVVEYYEYIHKIVRQKARRYDLDFDDTLNFGGIRTNICT